MPDSRRAQDVRFLLTPWSGYAELASCWRPALELPQHNAGISKVPVRTKFIHKFVLGTSATTLCTWRPTYLPSAGASLLAVGRPPQSLRSLPLLVLVKRLSHHYEHYNYRNHNVRTCEDHFG